MRRRITWRQLLWDVKFCTSVAAAKADVEQLIPEGILKPDSELLHATNRFLITVDERQNGGSIPDLRHTASPFLVPPEQPVILDLSWHTRPFG